MIPKRQQEKKNKLFYGDNLDVLRHYIKDESVDLCYIDPPFNSKRNYNQIYNSIGKEDRAQAFVDTWTWGDCAEKEFTDIISSPKSKLSKQTVNLIIGLEKVIGKGDLLAYLVSMTVRLAEIYRVLKPTGSFYLHCDSTASHYLKLILDSIYCPQGGDFRRELIWSTEDTSGFKSQAKNWIRSHDCILYYAKSDKFTFHKELAIQEHKEEYKRRFKKTDNDGRAYRDDRPGGRRQYLDDTQGKYLGDVWHDIMSFQQASTSAEYLGYPTQKPLQLLERILSVCSNEDSVILDAYCGCGTTIAAAEKLSRQWIGIDITYQSISLILKRLEKTYGKPILDTIKIAGTPEDIESAIALATKDDDRLRKEFEKWAILTFSQNKAIINEKKGGDGGIDGIAYMMDWNDNKEKDYKPILFSVKSNKSLTPSVIRDLYGTVEREKAAVGYLLTLYPMENLVKESIKYGIYRNTMVNQVFPKIEVVSVQDILMGKHLTLPITIDVVKNANQKAVNNQITLQF